MHFREIIINNLEILLDAKRMHIYVWQRKRIIDIIDFSTQRKLFPLNVLIFPIVINFSRRCKIDISQNAKYPICIHVCVKNWELLEKSSYSIKYEFTEHCVCFIVNLLSEYIPCVLIVCYETSILQLHSSFTTAALDTSSRDTHDKYCM